MSIESEVFKTFSPDFKKLKKYGFNLIKKEYIFEKVFMDETFKAKINISESGEITGTVLDLENDDEFLPLRVESNEGAFVGEVREAYKAILTDIRDNCFVKYNFISLQANRLADLILKKYNDNPLFMWEDYPTCGVFKNPDSKKWYGIIMDIPYTKLGEKKKGNVEVINLKIDAEKIPELIKKDGIYPAWHMNKKYWVSVALDDRLSDNNIMTLVAESHDFTV